MRHFFFIVIICLASLSASGQPDIQKSIHITGKHCWDDFGYTNPIGPTSHFLKMCYVPGAGLYGVTAERNALINNPPNYSEDDFRIYRIDPTTYDTLWSKAYGGSKDEKVGFYQIEALPNGHILVAGATRSYDLDFVTNPVQGSTGIFFMELDTAGNKVRTRILNSNAGGPSGTTIRDMIVDGHGNIYAIGDTWQNNMDFAHVSNGKDGYVVKLDSNLNTEWTRFWVGYGSDQPAGLGFIHNGNIAVTGVTSDTGTTAMLGHLNQGIGELFIEAYSPQGVTLWKNRWGGKNIDLGRKVVYGPNTNDIYVIGETISATGDIGYHTANVSASDTNALENQNLWILKLDTMGNLIHSKAYGSKTYGIYPQQETYYEDAIWYGESLWVIGQNSGGGGDIDTNNYQGGANLWFGTYDNKANLTSKHTSKGNGSEALGNLLVKDGGLLALGNSRTGGIVQNNFSCDTAIKDFSFLLGIVEAPLSVSNISKKQSTNLFRLYPNPSSKKVTIELLPVVINRSNKLLVVDAQGKKVCTRTLKEKKLTFDCAQWPVGLYYLRLQSDDEVQVQTFLKQ